MNPILADDDLLAEYAVLSVAIEEGRLTEDAPEVRDLLNRTQASLAMVGGDRATSGLRSWSLSPS